MTNNILFVDLDDTLFEEVEYVKSGFLEVSKYIAEINKTNSEEIFNQMVYQFNKYGRTGVFNRVMSFFEFDIPSVSDMIVIYRNHKPNIQAYEGVYNAITNIRSIYNNIFVITDGVVEVQKNKVSALNLEKYIDGVIYCMEYNSPKPSIISIEQYTQNILFDKSRSMMIGDDPFCDIECAYKFGINAVRVLTGRFKDIRCNKDNSVLEFNSFCDVAKFLIGGNSGTNNSDNTCKIM